MFGTIADQVVLWEVKQQCHLVNAIFSQVVDHRVQELQKEFREALRIMQLIPHEHAVKHFQKFSSNHKATLELLREFKANLSEYQGILGYLHYWQKEH